MKIQSVDIIEKLPDNGIYYIQRYLANVKFDTIPDIKIIYTIEHTALGKKYNVETTDSSFPILDFKKKITHFLRDIDS